MIFYGYYTVYSKLTLNKQLYCQLPLGSLGRYSMESVMFRCLSDVCHPTATELKCEQKQCHTVLVYSIWQDYYIYSAKETL